MQKFNIWIILKRWWWMFIVLSLVGTIFYYNSIASKQSYTAETMIEYIDIDTTTGLSPSGNKIDVTELFSSNVIYGAMDDLGTSMSIDTIRNGIKIIPIIPEDAEVLKESILEDGVEYEYFPKKYIVKFTLGAQYSQEFVRRVLESVLSNYFTYYVETYVNVDVVTNSCSYAMDEGYDYLESVEIVDKSLEKMISYLSTISKTSNDFRSSKTGYSFNDLLLMCENVYSLNMNRLYSTVLDNALSKDQEILIEKYKKRNNNNQLQIVSFKEKIKSIVEVKEAYIENNGTKDHSLYDDKHSYDNNNLGNNNIIEYQGDDIEVNKTTSYDKIVFTEIEYRIEKETLEQDVIYNDYVIKEFKKNAHLNTYDECVLVQDELRDLINESEKLHKSITSTVNEYNQFLATKNVLGLSTSKAYSSINTKMYLMLAFVFFLFAGVALSIGIGFVARLISRTLCYDSKTGLFNRVMLDKALEKISETPLESDTVCVTLTLHNLGDLNKTIGRRAGDVMMANIGKIITVCSQGYGSIYYNGGNVMCGFFENCDLNKASFFEEHLKNTIDKYNDEYIDTPIDLTIVLCEAEETGIYDARQLLRKAIIEGNNSKINSEKSSQEIENSEVVDENENKTDDDKTHKNNKDN